MLDPSASFVVSLALTSRVLRLAVSAEQRSVENPANPSRENLTDSKRENPTGRTRENPTEPTRENPTDSPRENPVDPTQEQVELSIVSISQRPSISARCRVDGRQEYHR